MYIYVYVHFAYKDVASRENLSSRRREELTVLWHYMFDRIDSLINETISVEGSKLNIGILWETLEGGDIVNRLYGDPCSLDSWGFLIYNTGL